MADTAQDMNETVIGVDLGGTNMQAAAVDGNGRITARRFARTRPDRGPDAIVEHLCSLIAEIISELDLSQNDLAGVGIAVAGAVEMQSGVVLRAPNLQWTRYPLREQACERLRVPVMVENDVNAAMWGEFCIDNAPDCFDAIGVWIGTGVGGGLVLNRQLWRGRRISAGEIGHTVINPFLDDDDRHRVLENNASRTGLSRLIRQWLAEHPDSQLAAALDPQTDIISARTLQEAWQQGDTLADRAVNHAARVLGVGIANCASVLSLDTVYIGGGVAEQLGQPFVDLIHSVFNASVFPPPDIAGEHCRFQLTQLAGDAGLIGAALLARTDLMQQQRSDSREQGAGNRQQGRT